MAKEHHIIYIPGLYDQNRFNKLFTDFFPRLWTHKGFPTHKFEPHWEEGSRLSPKLVRLNILIDQLMAEGYLVSLIGQSAGGSLAFNAFAKRKDDLVGAINVCGRLRAGENVQPSLIKASKNSLAFRESVETFDQKNVRLLNEIDRKRMMTVRAFYDETVPPSTTVLSGAKNVRIPFVGHSLTGGLVCSFKSDLLLGFLKGLE